MAEVVTHWLEDNQERINAGEKGRKVVEKNRGAVDAHIKLFRSLIA